MNSIRLAKHHAVGNDFLVLVDEDQRWKIEAHHARLWCDRHKGIGADGLIVVGPASDGADVAMTLFNADGSLAEISGNGIRCLGQAVAMSRGLDDLTLKVASGSGNRNLELRRGSSRFEMVASVEMGVVKPVSSDDSSDCDRGKFGEDHIGLLRVEVGNPHTVLAFDDLGKRDRVADALSAGQSNVELVLVTSQHEISMRVIERGVGETLACGSGACAAAFATRSWGMTADKVAVVMPGGEVAVELTGEEAMLSGPTVYVGDVVLPWP